MFFNLFSVIFLIARSIIIKIESGISKGSINKYLLITLLVIQIYKSGEREEIPIKAPINSDLNINKLALFDWLKNILDPLIFLYRL